MSHILKYNGNEYNYDCMIIKLPFAKCIKKQMNIRNSMEKEQQSNISNKFSNVYVKNMKSYYNIEIDDEYIKLFNKNKNLNLQLPLNEFAYVKTYPKLFETGKFTKIMYYVLLVLLGFSIFFLEITNFFFLLGVGGLIWGLYVLYQKERLSVRFYIREPEESFCYSFNLLMNDTESRNSIYKILKAHNKIGFNQLSNFKIDLNYFNKLKG